VNPSLLLISGWAHDVDAIQPMGDWLSEQFEVQLLTSAQVLNNQHVPDVDYIVAHSMGGLLAMELLPEICQKLVLISSTAKFCAGDDYPCGTPWKILRRMTLQLKRNPEAVVEEFFRNVNYPNECHTCASVTHTCASVRESLNSLAEGLEYLQASDVRNIVPTLGIPVLLLHGADDRIIPPTASEWLHAHLPDSQLTMIKNGGHALSTHHFAEVMDEISRFLLVASPEKIPHSPPRIFG